MDNPGVEAGTAGEIRLRNQEPARATMRSEVLAGLGSSPKHLPSQYLYDARGALLFEEICEQPEYYLTRTEAAIMATHMASIAEHIGPRALLIEPGSGDGAKSRLLLEGLIKPAGYMPIDISREQLIGLAKQVADRFPDIVVAPVCADFTDDPELPSVARNVRRRVTFLPGSTIGNFDARWTVEVLADLRHLAGDGGRVLIGVDLKKDAAILEPAYNDARGVSARFALNFLQRLNRELGADFDLDAFAYEAPYNAEQGRIEMALVSLREQTVHIDDQAIELAKGERVRTEYSYKFDLEQFRELAERAGLAVEQVWTDPEQLFSVQLLVAA